MRPGLIVGLLVLLTCGGTAVAQRKLKPGPGGMGRPEPLIGITSQDADFRACEARLAQFLRALQLDQRSQAARLFATQVTPAEREAFVRKRWLTRDATARTDFSQLLFQPELQIRTRRFARNAADLVVLPRTIKKGAVGSYGVRMRRERGDWRVELHPDKV